MASQLSLYNGALLLVGERFLESLTEECEPRRLLDFLWSAGALKHCLERGQWHFAMRTVQIDYDPSIEPPFGYRRAFQKPDDWVFTSGLCSDEFFRSPLTRYIDEAGFWYADLDTLYVRFVSDDLAYGMNLAGWPETFREYVEAYFASRIVAKLSDSEEEEKEMHALAQERLKIALSAAAMAQGTAFPAQGSWSAARNRYPNRRDGGNRSGPLIG
jgi:hypothetical protein